MSGKGRISLSDPVSHGVRRFGAEFEKLLYLSLMGGWEHPLDADGATALLEEPTPA